MEKTLSFSQKSERDYKLVCEARDNNDRKAYIKLMKLYESSLYFTMLKMTNNCEDAKDLTMEAFEKAFQKLDTYEKHYCFSTWLFKIAINNCIDFIRKKKIKLFYNDISDDEGESMDFMSNLSSKGPNPEEQMMKEQKINEIQEKVKKLTPQYRSIVELRYIKEMQLTEISDLLKIPMGTVKAQLFRARDFLTQSMKGIYEAY